MATISSVGTIRKTSLDKAATPRGGIRYDEELWTVLTSEAKKKGLQPSTYARMLLRERLLQNKSQESLSTSPMEKLEQFLGPMVQACVTKELTRQSLQKTGRRNTRAKTALPQK